MDPSKIWNYGGTSTFKPNKLAYLPPAALAIRGRGKSLQSLCSVRIRAEKRNPITKILNFNASISSQNEPVQNSVAAPPGYDPIENNGPCSPEVEVMQDTQINEISAHDFEKGKKVRGTNICKNVARLKPGEKLHISFYQNRVVGENYASFVRHLGILVRDRNMCPLRVHSWADIKEDQLEHMWDTVTDKFTNDDMNVQKEHVLQHMRRLWNNRRGSLHKNMKSKTFCDALKDVPRGVDKSYWEWLVKEHFLSENFKGWTIHILTLVASWLILGELIEW